MGRMIHYCDCGEELFDDIPCSRCITIVKDAAVGTTEEGLQPNGDLVHKGKIIDHLRGPASYRPFNPKQGEIMSLQKYKVKIIVEGDPGLRTHDLKRVIEDRLSFGAAHTDGVLGCRVGHIEQEFNTQEQRQGTRSGQADG